MENTTQLQFMAAPANAFIDNVNGTIKEQAEAFRKKFFSRFVAQAHDELPMMIYGRKMIFTPESGDVDCIFFGAVPEKEMVPKLIENMLSDGCIWVMHISEAYRFESNLEGEKKPDTKQECIICATYSPGWSEMALHSFDRFKGDLPLPIGDWDVIDTEDGLQVGGALVPFSDDKKGN